MCTRVACTCTKQGGGDGDGGGGGWQTASMFSRVWEWMRLGLVRQAKDAQVGLAALWLDGCE